MLHTLICLIRYNFLQTCIILLAVVGHAGPAAGRALAGLASVSGFCEGAAPLDTIEDLAAEAFGKAHPAWAGSEVRGKVLQH